MLNYKSDIDSGQKWTNWNATSSKWEISYTYDSSFNTSAFTFPTGRAVTGAGNAQAWDPILSYFESLSQLDFQSASPTSAALGLTTGSVEGSFTGAGMRNPTTGEIINRGLVIVEHNGPELLIHELGHALGLDHPGHGSGTASSHKHYTADSTIMRYRYDGTSNMTQEPYVAGKSIDSLMIYDIALLQQKYGTNVADWVPSTHVINGAPSAHTIWDGGGLDDVIDASNATGAAIGGINGYNVINLTGGVDAAGTPIFSQVGQEVFAIALDPRTNWSQGIIIEHAKGTLLWRNKLIGNDGNNSLVGGNYVDTLSGGLGNDTLVGGGQNDEFIFNYQSSGTDTVTDFNAAGNASTGEKLDFSAFGITSAQLASMATQVGADTHIILDADYKIVLTGVTKAAVLDNASGLVTGTTGNHAIGNSGNNSISKIVAGANGLKATIYNDTLTGGVGNDTLDGAEGSDTYVWKRGDGNDRIREVFTLTDVNKLRLEGVSVDDIRMTYQSVPTLQIQVINPNGTAETITFDQAQRIYGTNKADVSKGFAIRYLELDNTIIDLTKGINIRPLQNTSVAYGMEGLIADNTFEATGPLGSLSLNGFEGNDTYIVDFAKSPQNTYISDISGFNKLIVRNSDGYNLTVTDSTLNGDRLYKYTKTQNGVTTTKQIVIINFNAHSKQWGFSSGQDENVVVGSAAQDMLLDLVGNSTITSGAGSDTVQFVREANTADTITDFTVGQDKIDLSHASFNGLQYSNLVLSTSGSNALVYLGDNQQIRVNGVSHTALTSSQFKFATASGGTQGTSGNDTLNGTSAANQILGLDGNDVINGLGGNDTLNGGNGADTLNGGDNDDKLEGKDGNDSLDGGTGNDTVFGDNGNDIAYGRDGNDAVYGWYGIDTLYGGNGNDVLGGDYDNDRLYGEAGADTLYGGDGADSLTGGADNDYVFGEAGNDTAVGAEGNDWIDLGAGNDRMETAFQHVTAADTIQGGAGLDVFHITSSTVAVSLDTGTLANLRGFETISVQNNAVTLTLGDSYLNAAGFEGAAFTFNASTSTFAATVNAGGVTAKNLALRSGSGHDSLTGGSGADSMLSGSGNDTLTGGSGNDTLDAGTGDDRLLGDNGNDLSYGRDGNDTQFGWYGQDTLWGGNGNDTLGGDYDNDLLYGEAGNDNLFGHDGNDTLNGGAGTDALTGGAGVDRFAFTVASDSPLWTGDWIYDFAVGMDKLDVSAIKTGIDVIGNAAFSGTGAAQWRYYALNGNTVNHLDANGDGTVDFEVVMVGSVTISESDFVFN